MNLTAQEPQDAIAPFYQQAVDGFLAFDKDGATRVSTRVGLMWHGGYYGRN